MAVLQNTIKKIGWLRFIFLLWFVGFILGIFSANLLKQNYVTNKADFDLLFLSNVKSVELDQAKLFLMILGKRLRDFMLIWVFSITILYLPYNLFFLLYQGFLPGFFLTIAVTLYQFKGIALILSYYIPQCFLYIPITFISIMKGYSLYKNLNQNKYGKFQNRIKPVLEQVPIFGILLVGMIIGCAVEAYINFFLVQKALMLF